MSRAISATIAKRLRAIDGMAMIPEDRVWAMIRELGAALDGWRFSDLADRTTANRRTVRDYVSRLVRGGYLARDGAYYRLARDNGVERPQVRKDGAPVPMSNREKMWLAMEGMRNFSHRDLAFVTGVPAIDVKCYIGYLARVGILTLVEPSQPGKVARHTLCQWTGPKPLQIRRDKSVFDPNTGKEYPVPGPNVKLVRRVIAPLPDWILALATACDADTQGHVATRIGYSKGVVSQVLKGIYKGRVDLVEQAVRQYLMEGEGS
ncbi:MAG: hypothetical protein HQL79_07635 [Magnetococcales bacterium]|nr:hypothetical protein [Magnetococcales bacterium]